MCTNHIKNSIKSDIKIIQTKLDNSHNMNSDKKYKLKDGEQEIFIHI